MGQGTFSQRSGVSQVNMGIGEWSQTAHCYQVDKDPWSAQVVWKLRRAFESSINGKGPFSVFACHPVSIW